MSNDKNQFTNIIYNGKVTNINKMSIEELNVLQKKIEQDQQEIRNRIDKILKYD